jgi:hypothetical protein
MSQNYLEKAVVDMAIQDLLDAYQTAAELARETAGEPFKERNQKIATLIESGLRKIACYGTVPTTERYLAKIEEIKRLL